jgi:outer membrane lipoprotein-sorting protein
MNKFLRLGLSAMALMFVFSIFAATETKAQGTLNDILKTMDAHNKALTSLKASVTMEKFNAQLDETDTTTGTTMYLPKTAKREMYARIDWEKPVVENIAVIGNKYTLYRPRLNQVIEGTTEKSKNNATVGGALAFMSMSKNQLKANYNVRYLGQESVSGSVSTWHLELTPKTKTTYKLAELWVDGNGMPVQAKVIENNNDSTTVFLSKLQKNVDIPGNVFAINYPKSAKLIKG